MDEICSQHNKIEDNMKYLRLFIILTSFLSMTDMAHAQIGFGKPFFRNFSSIEYKGHNRNFDIECDNEGRVFVANFEGLLVYDGAQWTNFHTPGISRITALHKTPEGTIWFGGNNVLGYVESSDSISLRYLVNDLSDSLSIGEVSRIFNTDKELRFATSEGQLFSVKNNKLHFLGPHTDKRQLIHFNGMEVTDEIKVQDMGFSVIGTTAFGVIAKRFDGTTINILTTEDGLCSNNINAMAYDGKGTIWGASDNGLFAIYQSNIYGHYGESDGLYGQVTSILADRDRLYVGTLQGLFILGENDKFSRVPEIDLACWQIIKNNDGTILAATANGVFSISQSVHQIIPNHTLSLYAEPDGKFLAGTLDGIIQCSLNGSTITTDHIANIVKFRYHKGCVWAVDINNATYYRPESGTHFARGKSKDYSVLFDYTDKDGHIWKTSRNGHGLVSSALSEKQNKWCKPLSDYSIQAMDINQDGIAWIGGNFGLIRMNLNLMNSIDMYSPNIYIRSIKYGTADIHISVAQDKHDPIGKTIYSYRLHDDDEWSYWTTDQMFNFNNIAPGSYQISVRLSDAYGNIATSKPILFEVPIPFFFRWYMLVVYVLFFLFLAYLFFRWRTYRTQLEKERLEEVVKERTRDLKEAQNLLLRQEREATVGKLTKGLIDRILNPMNYINNFSHLSIGLAKDLSENLEDDKENITPDIYEDSVDVIDMLKTNLEKIQQHGLSTTRILKAMEELLKDRSRKLEPANIVTLCDQALEVFSKYNNETITQYSVRIEKNYSQDELISRLSAQNMSRAILSILANSIYAVRKKAEREAAGSYTPTIRISLFGRSSDSPARIGIYDNGIGIEDSIIDKVFDPFFTTKPTAEAPGVGLYFSQQVIQDVGGSISISSVKDSHTEVTITLPK